MLTVRLLGQFDVQRDDTPVEIPSRPAQSLLAYLMLNAGTAQRRERLAGLLWPDASESNARANLRHTLWRLRQAIGADYILADRVSVTFDAHADYWLDTAVLESQPLAGGSVDDLIEGVSAYAGELLPGFYDEWVTWERERLNAVYEDRMQALLERLVAEQRWGEVHDWAERWIAGGQVPEPAYRALMQAHAGLGDRAGMAAAYQRCVEALETELGVPPSPETVQLYQRLSAGESPSLTPIETPRLERRTNLPTPPTPFVGREALLAKIGARLQEPACRLLTLVGPGGSGKTRLALEAAAARLDAHEHGVFCVSLAPLEAVEEIVPTVAQAVGFGFYGSVEGGETVAPRQQLLDYLRNKSMLLVMDNYEHLLDSPPALQRGASPPQGGTELLTDILQTAPQVKILATSRANLNLPQEHRFPIPGMEFPDSGALEQATDYSAVKLFLDAARRAQPDFAASPDNLRDVVRICRLVTGMPLGVLLAAGWLPMLSPAEIATEIEKSLDFLETDLRGIPDRQRSVRAVFDHSWRLLTDQEQNVLAQLSVFRGGFTRRAAQAVTGATLRDLKALVDKSLLGQSTAPSAGLRAGPATGLRAGPATGLRTEGRYELHELLCQYTAERLDADPDRAHAARDRHSAYYVGFLQRRERDLKGAGQLTALAEIEADAENARAAWNWAADQGHVERLGRAMEGLCLFYERQGRYEQGDRACRRAAEKLAKTGVGDDVPSGYEMRVRARALTWRGVFSGHLVSGEIALQLVRRGLSLLDRPELADHDIRAERAFALREMGYIKQWTGEAKRARGLVEGSLALYRELGDRWGIANALFGAGRVAFGRGAFVEAQGWYGESLALRRALGDQRGVAESLYALGGSLIAQGQSQEAKRLAREVIAISRETNDRVCLASGLYYMGWALHTSGRFAEAHAVTEESVAIWEELGSRSWLASAIGELGASLVHLGRYKDARAQLQLSLRLARETGSQIYCEISPVFLGWVALVEGAYSEARRWFQEGFSAAQTSGRRRHRNWAVAGLGFVERGLGNLRQARGHLYEALRMSAELEAPYYVLPPLPGIALLLADEGQTERAVELYALASRYRYVANSQWWKDVAGKYIAAVADALPPDVVAAAQERGRMRDLKETLTELLAELEAAVDGVG